MLFRIINRSAHASVARELKSFESGRQVPIQLIRDHETLDVEPSWSRAVSVESLQELYGLVYKIPRCRVVIGYGCRYNYNGEAVHTIEVEE